MREPYELIDGFIEGTLSESEAAALNAWVEASDDHAFSFVQESLRHYLLREHIVGNKVHELIATSDDTPELRFSSVLAQALAQELAVRQRQAAQRQAEEAHRCEIAAERDVSWRMMLGQSEPVQPVQHIVIPRSLVYSAAAAAIALVALAAAQWWPQTSHSHQPPVTTNLVESIEAVGLISVALDARWPDEREVVAGEAIMPGAHKLVSGKIQITFNNGAQLYVQGPAEFEPIDGGRVRLTRGNIVGYCVQGAQGFTVSTPNSELIDLGTEFGVSVDDEGVTDAHVFVGSVQVTPLGNGRPTREPAVVPAGEARQINASGTEMMSIPVDDLAFVRRSEFDANAAAARGSAYHRWLAYSYELRRHPALLAYYPFDNRDEASDRLINRAPRTGATLDGVLESRSGVTSGPRWMTGRFESNGALWFDANRLEQVRIEHDPVLNFTRGATFAVWLRVDDPDRRHHLITKRYGSVSSVNLAWVGRSPENIHIEHSVLFQTNMSRGHRPYETRSILKNRTDWVHIAAAHDGHTITIYVDGKVEHVVDDSNNPFPHIDAPLLIGGVGDVREDENFGGMIDEVAIFDEALTAEDIRRMYEAGKPF